MTPAEHTSSASHGPYPRVLRGAPLGGLGYTDGELARLAVTSARQAVESMRQAGIEPSPELVARADGDPVRVAAYVAHQRRTSGTTTAA